jgi:hypothetical protein
LGEFSPQELGIETGKASPKTKKPPAKKRKIRKKAAAVT